MAIQIQIGVRYDAVVYLLNNKHLLKKFDKHVDLAAHVRKETGSTVDDVTISTLCYAIILQEELNVNN